MDPEDWLVGAQDAGCLGHACESLQDSNKWDVKTLLVSLAIASILGAVLLMYTWARADGQQCEEPAPDWPQGSPAARSDGLWTLQPQWQEPLEGDNSSSAGSASSGRRSQRSQEDAANAFETVETGLDSFLGEEFEPLALTEHPATPEASPPQHPQNMAVGVLMAPMQLPLPAASTPTLQLQPPASTTGAVPLPLNHLLSLPDSTASRSSPQSAEYLDLDASLTRSFPATPEWSDWSNVWFAGPEGPRRAFTESQLIPAMANYPVHTGWRHPHQPVEDRLRSSVAVLGPLVLNPFVGLFACMFCCGTSAA